MACVIMYVMQCIRSIRLTWYKCGTVGVQLRTGSRNQGGCRPRKLDEIAQACNKHVALSRATSMMIPGSVIAYKGLHILRQSSNFN